MEALVPKNGGIHILTEDSTTKMWSLLNLDVTTSTIHYDSDNQANETLRRG